jgi:hypothetical protein
MNDIRLFSKPINAYAEETLEIKHSIQSSNIAKETLAKYKKRTEHIINDVYSFDGRFREIIERKRTIRTLTAEEETALTEFSQKRTKLIADLKTELKKIEEHPLIKKPAVSENASPVSVEVAKPSLPKNTTATVEEKKEKKSKAPAKKESTKVDKEQEKREKLLAKEQEKEQARQAKLLAKEQEKEQARQAKLLAKATKPKI